MKLGVDDFMIAFREGEEEKRNEKGGYLHCGILMMKHYVKHRTEVFGNIY